MEGAWKILSQLANRNSFSRLRDIPMHRFSRYWKKKKTDLVLVKMYSLISKTMSLVLAFENSQSKISITFPPSNNMIKVCVAKVDVLLNDSKMLLVR